MPASLKRAISTRRRQCWSPRRERDGEGQALVIVLILSVALIMLVTVAVSSSMANLGFSASYGNTSQAQLTAFSGLSQATNEMATAGSIGALPCSVAGTMPLPQTAGSNDTYSVTIAYSGTGTQGCQPGQSTSGYGTPGGTPTSAVLTSTGTTPNTTPLVMQENVAVLAVASLMPPFTYALLSESTMNLTTGLTISGVSSANVYGGTVNQCQNSASINGSVQSASPVTSVASTLTIGSTCDITGNLYVNGSVTIGQKATIQGSVYAYGGSVTLSQSATVGGSIYAVGGTSTPGDISIDTNTSPAVSGSLYATGTISDTIGGVAQTVVNGSSLSNVVGSVNEGVLASTMPTEPPNQTFPQLDPTVTSLTNAGYSVVQLGGLNQPGCSTFSSYAAVANTSATAIYAPTCAVSLSGSNTFNLSSNTVWVIGGLTNSGSLTVGSTSLASYDLSVVVPTGTSCPSGDILFNGSTFSALVNALFYTPCSVSLTGNQTLTGQILTGGDINTTGNFTLTFNQQAAGKLPGTEGNPMPTTTVESKTVLRG